MESERIDRPTRNILRVILSSLLGAVLGLFVAVIGFEHFWGQPTLELQPTHIAFAVGASLLYGSLAAIDVKKFLVGFIESLGNGGW